MYPDDHLISSISLRRSSIIARHTGIYIDTAAVSRLNLTSIQTVRLSLRQIPSDHCISTWKCSGRSSKFERIHSRLKDEPWSFIDGSSDWKLWPYGGTSPIASWFGHVSAVDGNPEGTHMLATMMSSAEEIRITSEEIDQSWRWDTSWILR